MSNIKTNSPENLKENHNIKDEMTESEAYKKAQEINKSGEGHATVENGSLNVDQVLKG